jgi:hypothetical protein
LNQRDDGLSAPECVERIPKRLGDATGGFHEWGSPRIIKEIKQDSEALQK